MLPGGLEINLNTDSVDRSDESIMILGVVLFMMAKFFDSVPYSGPSEGYGKVPIYFK